MYNRIKQMHGKIERLFWLPAQLDSEEFFNLICDLSEDEIEAVFPNHYMKFDDYDDSYEFLTDNQLELTGFIAEVMIPNYSNFYFSEGKPVSWSVMHDELIVQYVYAETLDDLLNKVEFVSDAIFNSYVQKALKNN